MVEQRKPCSTIAAIAKMQHPGTPLKALAPEKKERKSKADILSAIVPTKDELRLCLHCALLILAASGVLGAVALFSHYNNTL